MAGKGDIKAGGAFVELFVKGAKFEVGLRKAAAKLKSFGGDLSSFGTKMAAAGAAMAAPFIFSVKHFTDAGSAVADMAARTGLSTEAISELGFAAQQTGTDISTVEAGVRRMQKTISEAAGGSESAAKALAEFGLSAEALIGLSPDKQLEAIAAGLAAIDDPAKRSAATMAVLGKSGTALIPMLADITALRAEAKRLGFTMSAETAAAADKLGDAIDVVKASVGALAIKVGAALAPEILRIAEKATEFIALATDWVSKNRELVVSAAAIVAGIAAAGSALMAFGITVSSIGSGLTALAAVFGAVLSGAAALLTPIGAITAGIVAIAAVIVYTTGLLPKLIDSFKPLMGAIKTIAKSLISGDFKKAWDVAATSIKYVASVALDWFVSLPELAGYAAGAVARALIDGLSVVWEWVKSMPSLIEAMLSGDMSIGDMLSGAHEAALGKIKSTADAMKAGFRGDALPELGSSERTKKLRDALDALTGEDAKKAGMSNQMQNRGKGGKLVAAAKAGGLGGARPGGAGGGGGDGPVTVTFSGAALVAQTFGGRGVAKPEDKIVAALKADLVEAKKMVDLLADLVDELREKKGAVFL